MEAVVERANLRKALAQVRRNKGAPGINGMTVDELAPHLRDHWPAIRTQLLDGTYRPQPVLWAEIPKAGGGGGMRALGIPTVLDRWYCCIGRVQARFGPPPLGQAARPKIWCTKARWAGRSLVGTARTCPLPSIAMASMPASVRRAVQKL
jgi:hypothetical protein